MTLSSRYHLDLVAAFVRGSLSITEKMSDEDLYHLGREKGLELHKFKKNSELPRVSKVLGLLQGIYPQTLLDVGSGRGTFLWPLIKGMPHIMTNSVDILDFRVDNINAIREGGIMNVQAFKSSVTDLSFEDDSYDVVTALEVLEHIPEASEAVDEIVRVAKNYVIVSVPSKEDDNPEHIHVLREDWMKDNFGRHDVNSIKFDYVNGHMIVFVKL